MSSLLTSQTFSCLTSYAIETIDPQSLETIRPYFENLPEDPYLSGHYRFRRFSRFEVEAGKLKHLPHHLFFQSKSYNRLLGDVARDYEELEAGLVALPGFHRAVLTFFEFCARCAAHTTLGVHQIRVTTSAQQRGNPAPEGIHQDGVEMVGVLCINRSNIVGAQTYLYPGQSDSPIFSKVLNPGELLVFNDRQFFHFTSPISPASSEEGSRDVFVFTCPDTPFTPTLTPIGEPHADKP